MAPSVSSRLPLRRYVSAAAEEVSRNVQTVATGTEEMSASIKEIAKNANEAAKVATGNDLGKIFVFVHSTAPHDVIVLEAGEEFIARGRALWDRAVRTYAACVQFDDWPGMAAGFTSSQLQAPRWA